MKSNRFTPGAIVVAHLAAMGIMLFSSRTDAYSTAVRVETVSNYTLIGGGNTDANTEAQAFWDEMTQPGTGWTAGTWYKDNSVWDRDFYDPEVTANSGDNDSYTDHPNTGISVYIGHGNCNDLTWTGACTTDANCPAGAYCAPSYLYAGQQRSCISEVARSFITSSTNDAHGHNAWYGKTYGSSVMPGIAWGESLNSGGWAGAGTNGGTNIALMVNSCGFRSRFLSEETSFMFAGMHALLGTMPTNVVTIGGTFGQVAFTDTAQWANRGAYLSYYILQNQAAPIGDAWLNPSMVANGFSGGGTGAANVEGANIIVGKDVTASNAYYRAYTETWYDSQYDFDPTGLGYWYWQAGCTYNCYLQGL